MPYQVGSIDTSRGNQRPLIDAETREIVAWVTCDPGPALLGTMSDSWARAAFPEAFDDAEEWDDDTDEETLCLDGCDHEDEED